jgi:hypothetical protein
MANYLNFGVKTRDSFKQWILIQLGYPLIQVELAEQQLDTVIDDAISVFTQYAIQEKRYIALNVEDYVEDVGILLPDTVQGIFSIDKATFGGANGGGINDLGSTNNVMFTGGIIPDPATLFMGTGGGGLQIGQLVEWDSFRQYAKMLSKIMGNEVQFSFNERTHYLELYPDPTKKKEVGHVVVGCFVIRKDDDNFGEHWVKRYALCCAKEILRIVRGKFSGITLLGGGQINQSLLSDAKAEKDELLKELQEVYVPMEFYVG